MIMRIEIACVAGGVVLLREQSFGRGAVKPCGEWEEDALRNFLAPSPPKFSHAQNNSAS